ncbi:MAG: hypothetical protein WKF77_17850 [Planctomycetaceae bacterium]
MANLEPEVYYRLTDIWLEVSVRFVTSEYGVRKLKEAISRDLIERLKGKSRIGMRWIDATLIDAEIRSVSAIRLQAKGRLILKRFRSL